MARFLAKKKISWLLAFCLLWLPLSSVAQEGLLYRVSKPGQGTHYLFGTMHSDDSRVIGVLDRLAAPLEKVDQVVLEIVPDAGSLIEASLSLMLPPDQQLSRLLGDRLYRRVAEAMRQRGVPELALQHMKPWAVAVTLGTPTLTGNAMDQVIYQRALARGKRLEALETPEEQLALFDELPLSLQKRMLEEVLAQQKSLPRQLEQLTQAYLSGDLQRLLRLSLEYDAAGDPRLANWFRDHLIVQRNRRMAKRLLPLLSRGPTLVAVGALHLPGNEGLIKLLQQAGYRVEVVP
jgi:uncharacterized protein YbaP (TraB family)